MRRSVVCLLAVCAVPAAATFARADPLTNSFADRAGWSGLYLGVNVGGGWAHQDASLNVPAAGATLRSTTLNPDGVVGGGQLGYNWQNGKWVFGVETDIQASGQRTDGLLTHPGGTFATPGGLLVVPPATVAYTEKLDWFGTVRGRAGIAMNRWLPYVTAGFAYGHGTISGAATAGPFAGSLESGKSYAGWTVGAGIEWAFWQRWSAKVEYLHIDFGNGPTVPIGALLNLTTGRLTDEVVRAGVNYRF